MTEPVPTPQEAFVAIAGLMDTVLALIEVCENIETVEFQDLTSDYWDGVKANMPAFRQLLNLQVEGIRESVRSFDSPHIQQLMAELLERRKTS